MIPRGGFKFGYPSVSNIVKTFFPLWLIFFSISKLILSPSQIFVVPWPYKSLILCSAIFLPALFIFVVCKIHWAPVLKVINVSSSPSFMNSIKVFIECLTKSSLLNPWLSESLESFSASMFMESDVSRMQTKEMGFLLSDLMLSGGIICKFRM